MQLEIRFLARLGVSREKGFDYLQEYSRHFSTVEVDQWFWSLLREMPP